MTFADRVLDWLLRQGADSVSLEAHDLVVVRDHKALRDPSPSATLMGETWRVVRVTGELTLRNALLDAGRLVAIVPEAMGLPLDLAGRAWMGRPVQVRPRDLVAALSGRACQSITDPATAAAIEAHLDVLRAVEGGWSRGGVVSEREIRSVLVALQLGDNARLERAEPHELLARWIVDGPPQPDDVALMADALREEHGRPGKWLAWALHEGSLQDLVAAGALALVPELAKRGPTPPSASTPGERKALAGLVEAAVRDAWTRAQPAAVAALTRAEALAAKADVAQARGLPLLRGPLERALHHFGERCAAGTAPDDAELEALGAHLHIQDLGRGLDLLRDAARLARFARAVPLPAGDTAEAWTGAAHHVAWADLAWRRLRRTLGDAPAALRRTVAPLAASWPVTRDTWNEHFATWLTSAWPSIAATKDVRRPLPLHEVTRAVVRPLLLTKQHVLLVVLDGCDTSTFIELLEGADVKGGLSIGLPAGLPPDLREDLTAQGPWRLLFAPLPTLTGHARRALFAGDIPGDTSLVDAEEVAPNASGDKKAFAANVALGSFPRTLLLKGDLDADASTLRELLRRKEHALIGVVFNDVDDALSSKETTPLGPWALAGLGRGALAALKEAVEQGWTVLVTADHGHTPFVDSDRKLGTKGLGGRVASAAQDGVATFTTGPLPFVPLHLAWRYGGWFGPQHRGSHGGAALEEVCVPLVMLGQGGTHDPSFGPPAWWFQLAETVEAAPVAVAASPTAAVPATAPAVVLPAAVQKALAPFPTGLRLVEHIAAAGRITPADLATAMEHDVVDLDVMLHGVEGMLTGKGLAHPFHRADGALCWGPAPAATSWIDAIEDAGERAVLAHLSTHGAIREAELVTLLGNARSVRRFANRVEPLSAAAPFRIAVESLPDGTKVYRKVEG